VASFRLSLEEPIGANFSHLGQDGLFFAAVIDSSIERLKRWNLNQWVTVIAVSTETMWTKETPSLSLKDTYLNPEGLVR